VGLTEIAEATITRDRAALKAKSLQEECFPVLETYLSSQCPTSHPITADDWKDRNLEGLERTEDLLVGIAEDEASSRDVVCAESSPTSQSMDRLMAMSTLPLDAAPLSLPQDHWRSPCWQSLWSTPQLVASYLGLLWFLAALLRRKDGLIPVSWLWAIVGWSKR